MRHPPSNDEERARSAGCLRMEVVELEMRHIMGRVRSVESSSIWLKSKMKCRMDKLEARLRKLEEGT